MSLIYKGDEGGILLEFLHARLDVNSAAWPVEYMGSDPATGKPCIVFGIVPSGSTPIVGGESAFSDFAVTVLCVGPLGVDNIEALRPVAIELGQNLAARGNEPGLNFASGRILHCLPSAPGAGPVTFNGNQRQGRARWHHGHRWIVRVQPDTA